MLNRHTLMLILLTVLMGNNTHATEYIVKIKEGANFNKVLSALHANSVRITNTNDAGRLAKIEINTAKTKFAAQQLSILTNHKNIEYIVENIKLHTFEKPNDEKFPEQWSLAKVGALGAWGKTSGSHEVIVAVIDTGADVTHQDLAANIWVNTKEIPGNNIDDDGNGFIDDINGWDFHQNDNTPDDETSAANPGHGTHCSGIIGAVGNNQVGITGMSQTVSIMPIRFLGKDGSGDLFASTKAIDYAIANGAQIISASWGAPTTKEMAKPIIEAIERANHKGVLFIAAAGNDGADNDNRPSFPANAGSTNVINVAASGPTDNKPTWSNKGRMTVDLAAPGEDILSTLPQNTYGKLSGTSMATPLVAGLAALLKSQDPSLTPEQIKAILQSSGTQIELETACKCRIDANKATSVVAEKQLTIIPNAGHLDINASLQFSAWGGTEPYSFTSSNPEIATISPEGKLEAISKGEVKITVTDAAGITSTSYNVYLGQEPTASSGCPFQDPMICLIMCQIMPEAPWCANNGGDDGNDGEEGETPDVPPEMPGSRY
ncbi:MAG: S8 family serine peptidase [bacterium]|nr:S8 family serine peptidase [bacterium]